MQEAILKCRFTAENLNSLFSNFRLGSKASAGTEALHQAPFLCPLGSWVVSWTTSCAIFWGKTTGLLLTHNPRILCPEKSTKLRWNTVRRHSSAWQEPRFGEQSENRFSVGPSATFSGLKSTSSAIKKRTKYENTIERGNLPLMSPTMHVELQRHFSSQQTKMKCNCREWGFHGHWEAGSAAIVQGFSESWFPP